MALYAQTFLGFSDASAGEPQQRWTLIA